MPRKIMNQTVVKTVLVGAAVVLSIAIEAAEKEELKLQLPQPLLIGTPQEISSPHLDPKRDKNWKRPAFQVPVGTELLSEEKAVTSSDPMPIIGDLELITDGDKEGTEGSYVELGPNKQWVQIDLGETREVHAILVWHYHSMARIYNDMIAQVSDDPDFTMDVTTVFNNDRDNSLGMGVGKDYEYVESYQGELIDAKGAKGRYVRLYSNGNTANDMNHYTEVEVFGK